MRPCALEELIRIQATSNCKTNIEPTHPANIQKTLRNNHLRHQQTKRAKTGTAIGGNEAINNGSDRFPTKTVSTA